MRTETSACSFGPVVPGTDWLYLEWVMNCWITDDLHFLPSLYFFALSSFSILKILFFFVFLPFFRAAHAAYGCSQARGLIGAVAASLHHSRSNIGSKLRLRSAPQLAAMPDPEPTERGQGSNPQAHGYQLDSFPLHHDGNSWFFFFFFNYYFNEICLFGCARSM